MVDLGSGAKRQIEDIALTRYACYLIAQNGDPAKEQRGEYRVAPTDREIDRLVYELHGLTEEEVRIVEGATQG